MGVGTLTMGQLLRLALYLWYALPALSMGFSVRPPPATMPTIARAVLGMTYGTASAVTSGRCSYRSQVVGPLSCVRFVCAVKHLRMSKIFML